MINMRFADWCDNSPGRSALSWTGSWDSGPSQRLSRGRRSRACHHSSQRCLGWGVHGRMWDLCRRRKRKERPLAASHLKMYRLRLEGVYPGKPRVQKPARIKPSHQTSNWLSVESTCSGDCPDKVKERNAWQVFDVKCQTVSYKRVIKSYNRYPKHCRKLWL